MYVITLRKGREKLPKHHHPWVFSNAIKDISPTFKEADWALVQDENERFLSYGWYDEKSNIILRLISWNEEDEIGQNYIKNLIKDAVERRKALFTLTNTNAFRLIHGDADYLPGITADYYNEQIIIIISSRFAMDNLGVIIKSLHSLLNAERIKVIVDKYYGSLENLSDENILFINGKEIKDEEKERNFTFKENGIYYFLDSFGQKSGFYLDQRDNRNIVSKYAKGRAVLDLFSYTGAFTLNALKNNASEIDAVDSSKTALSVLNKQIKLNEEMKTIPKNSFERIKTIEADCFSFIRECEKDKYDLIIIDPPKLARNKKNLERALKAYKDLNMSAMLKIKKGGVIATFSCSAALEREDFKKILAYAAYDAKKEIHILRTLCAGEDHPIRLSFPESEYLKGFIIRVI